jgi:hypothetical protein
MLTKMRADINTLRVLLRFKDLSILGYVSTSREKERAL